MSETGGAKRPDRHAIINLIMDNPISAFNAAAIIFGGGFVWATNENRMTQYEKQIQVTARENEAADRRTEINIATAVARIEKLENNAIVNAGAIQREVGELKTSIRGIETSLQFLIRQSRQPSPPGRANE